MTTFSKLVSVLLVLTMIGWVPLVQVQAQDAAAPPAEPAAAPAEAPRNEITPAAAQAIDRGLDYLAKAQNPDGSISMSDGRGGSGDVGITALAGIAFLAGGSTPGRGKYGRNVQRCTEYVLKCTNMTTGYINSGNSQMYQHGFAMLFLAEVFGMYPSPEVRKGLIQAVALLRACQSNRGGWRYAPVKSDDDISITICQMMALRAARNAGIPVDPGIIDKGIKYVEMCYSSGSKSFGYTPGSGGQFSSTAAGVCTLFYAGKYDSAEAKGGLVFLQQNMRQSFNGWPMYGNYYGAQAFHLAPNRDQTWDKYFPYVRDELLKRQRSDGSWSVEQGANYSTAMALIILQVPNEYLPILQH